MRAQPPSPRTARWRAGRALRHHTDAHDAGRQQLAAVGACCLCGDKGAAARGVDRRVARAPRGRVGAVHALGEHRVADDRLLQAAAHAADDLQRRDANVHHAAAAGAAHKRGQLRHRLLQVDGEHGAQRRGVGGRAEQRLGLAADADRLDRRAVALGVEDKLLVGRRGALDGRGLGRAAVLPADDLMLRWWWWWGGGVWAWLRVCGRGAVTVCALRVLDVTPAQPARRALSPGW